MSTAELSASLLGEQAVVYLSTVNPDALLLEPREWYDPCITGVATHHVDDWWAEQRDEDALPVFVYDYDLLVKAFMAHAEPEGSCSVDEAQEFVDFNMAGAWLGVGTPIIVTSFSDDGDEYDLDAPTEEVP